MRILPLIAAASIAAGGSVSAQSFLQPSRLPRIQHGQHIGHYPAPLPDTETWTDLQEPPTRPPKVDAPPPAYPDYSTQPYDVPHHDHAPCGGCGTADCCGACCGPSWFGSVGALIMSRDENDDIELTTPGVPGGEVIELINTNFAAQDDWQEGFEITIGRHLCCGSRVAATYWTLDPVENEISVFDPTSNLVSSLNFSGLDFLGGPVGSFFDGVQFHSLYRSSEFHNFEVNFWRDAAVCQCGESWRLSGMTGFRYFRFAEDVVYSSDTAAYAIEVENNMFGWQLGLRTDYQPTCSLSLFADARFGIYYNYLEHTTTLQSNAGDFAVDQFGQSWNIDSDKDDFSTLGQLELGGRWQINCNWSLYGGYRLVVASGVAMATEQIPFYMADFYGIRNIDTNSSLFLHGGFAGVEYQR